HSAPQFERRKGPLAVPHPGRTTVERLVQRVTPFTDPRGEPSAQLRSEDSVIRLVLGRDQLLPAIEPEVVNAEPLRRVAQECNYPCDMVQIDMGDDEQVKAAPGFR